MDLFRCDDGLRTVHFSLLCDFRHHCLDRSDEIFCRHAPCTRRACRSQQCVHWDEVCDGIAQCADLSDEDGCVRPSVWEAQQSDFVLPAFEISQPSPSIITLDGHGYFTQVRLETSQPCPHTHFRCGGNVSDCVPVYVRCNGVNDCPGKEDETGCDSYTCRGLYRCRGSTVCLHPDHVCDGLPQCPEQDDEMLCGHTCPAGCRCQGLAFVCQQAFPVTDNPGIRYLDATGSDMTPAHFDSLLYLVFLRMSKCALQRISNLTFPNLRHLDLSENKMAFLNMDVFLGLPNLRFLRLSSNPIHVVSGGGQSSVRQPLLQSVQLSFVSVKTFSAEIFSSFPNIHHLNLSFSEVHGIDDKGFKAMYFLKTLDLRGCPLSSFPRDVFQSLSSLEAVYADNYKLCCKDTLPDKFNVEYCFAPEDEISSCDSLLRSHVYRVFLWLLAGLAVTGNVFTIVFRLRAERGRSLTCFSIFVSNLGVADLLMGVYLAMVGGADQVYFGSYLWRDDDWKGSVACRVAGFLSLVSSEVSALTICLITLDRVIVLCFPFTKVRFGKHSALVACGAAWALGLLLAAVPLLPVTSSWRFYSQTGICIPLPVTRTTFPGQGYAFGVIIVFNFVLFLFIAAGQAIIYWSVKKNSVQTTDSSRKARDLSIARRLFTIVVTDFLCWFPIGLLGLLASGGVPIPGEVNVAMAIFVLPLNSALNPFLYTLNSVMEKSREREKAQMLKVLEARLKTEMSELGPSRVSMKGPAK
ncbi:hypothetical protein V1264_009989 [Littorina saxatilis]|uniref:G-protein coupled receptors family 1 profile domain-containing protein n=1 Tax=Littorina saxatilis TaxID=31220 RepID=A0AAN9ANH5_9CAEN